MSELSIIIPHYNDAERLRRCLNSIPIDEDIEVIVVDDNSKPEEQDKARQYVSERISNSLFFVNPNYNHSAGTCRNIGLKNASGKWVLFSDSDDYFIDFFYEKVKGYFDTDYDIVFFESRSREEVFGNASDRHMYYCGLVDDYLRNSEKKNELKLKINNYVPWGKLIRRSLITDNDIIFEEIRYSNDLMFTTKVGAYAKKICADENVIYCVTSSERSLTKIKNRESFDIRKQAMIRRYAFLYNHLTKEEMCLIDMKYMGIRYVLSPIRNGYGIKLAVDYIKLLKDLKVPLII